MTITTLQVFRYSLPFRTPVRLGHAWVEARSGVLVRVSDGESDGWGEAAPLPGWSSETEDDVVRELTGCLNDLPATGAALLVRLSTASGRFALDSASRAMRARQQGENVLIPRGRIRQPTLRRAVLAGDRSADERALEAPVLVQAMKVKVGLRPWREEVRLLRALRERLGPHAELRLDANRRFSLADARAFVRSTADLGIDYIEEPTANPAAWQSLTALGVSCALDETLHERARRKGADGRAFARQLVADHPHAAVLVVKPALLGAWSEMADVYSVAQEHERRVVVSSAYESGVGLQAVIALAAQNPRAEAAGLDTHARFIDDLLDPPLPLTDEFVDVEKACDLRRTVIQAALEPIA